MRVKQKNTIKMVRLIFLLGVAVFLGACSDEQVAPLKPITMYPAKPRIVRKVQLSLRNRGYYTGHVDGFLGQNTALAIQKFQIDHDLMERPFIDRALLDSLGIPGH
jgi:hypothetical protein